MNHVEGLMVQPEGFKELMRLQSILSKRSPLQYFRLRKIKQLRKLRDAALKTDNVGRARRMLLSFPGVCEVSSSDLGWNGAECEAVLMDGTTFKAYQRSNSDLLLSIHRVITQVYLYNISSI